MKKCILYIIISVLPVILFAQEPKREVRAVWVCSVWNADWPKEDHKNDYEAQKADLIAMFDEFRDQKINAIFFQVRPECDALYQSAYEPWSRYLSTFQGTDPGYDPLELAIEEGHKRGIEVHAYLNPYRINASVNDGGDYYHESHVFKEHPEWAIIYSSNEKILNPGLPEVMIYIGDVVEDIVSRYDVDGVHFDDYFYDSDGTPAALDAEAYALYGNGMSLDDWRRDNVNRLMDTVHSRIQKIDPNVRFGVSPPGTYRPGIPEGISGRDAWARLYCDALAWLDKGSIDYLAPQLYWPTGGEQDFETLYEWWSGQASAQNRHMFPGLALYKIIDGKGMLIDGEYSTLEDIRNYFDLYPDKKTNPAKSTSDPVSEWANEEIGKQIDFIRNSTTGLAPGNGLFRAEYINVTPGFQPYLNEHFYTHTALMPEMTWKSGPVPDAPQNVRIELVDGEYHLVWDHTPSKNDKYAVYVSSSESLSPEEIITEPENLQATSYLQSLNMQELVLADAASIIVTTVSPIGKESSPSTVYTLINQDPYVELSSPDNNAMVSSNELLSWLSSSGTDFQLQISKTNSFSALVYSSDWISSTSQNMGSLNLEGESPYFWRVRAKNSTITGFYCESREIISAYPATPELVYPFQLATKVDTRPRITWKNSDATENIRIWISKKPDLSELIIDELVDAESGAYTLSTTLDKETWYYIAIAGENSYGRGNFSVYAPFQTTSGTIPYIDLAAPATHSTVASFDSLIWTTSATEGTISFNLEVDTSASFNSVLYNSGWIPENKIKIEDLNLEGQQNYYWRVKGKSEYGESYFSDPWEFYPAYPMRPTITEPANLASAIDNKVLVGWEIEEGCDSVYTEFAENTAFEPVAYKESFVATPTSQQISSSLKPYSLYYLRIKAVNDYGRSIASKLHAFETGKSSAIESKDVFGEIKIYPTIVRDHKLYIENLNTDIRIQSIIINDITGRCLLFKEFNNINDLTEISLPSEAGSSLYVIRINTNKGMYTDVFDIQKP